MAPVILTWHLSQFDMAFAPNKPLSQVSSHHLAENHMSLLEEVQCGPKLAQTGILAAFTLRSSTGLFLRQTLIFAFGCLQSDAHLFIGAASNLCSMLLSSPPTHTHTHTSFHQWTWQQRSPGRKGAIHHMNKAAVWQLTQTVRFRTENDKPEVIYNNYIATEICKCLTGDVLWIVEHFSWSHKIYKSYKIHKTFYLFRHGNQYLL